MIIGFLNREGCFTKTYFLNSCQMVYFWIIVRLKTDYFSNLTNVPILDGFSTARNYKKWRNNHWKNATILEIWSTPNIKANSATQTWEKFRVVRKPKSQISRMIWVSRCLKCFGSYGAFLASLIWTNLTSFTRTWKNMHKNFSNQAQR